MNRIILVLVVLVFVQFVKSQVPGQACIDATTALTTNTACNAALATGTNFTAICMGTCRTLFDDIIDNCDNTTASTYTSLLSSLCGPCGMAQQALITNPTCASATDPSSICMGTCRDVYDNIISNCDASVGNAYSMAISTICNGTTIDACTTAASNVDASCAVSLSAANTSVCSGTCGVQLSAVVSACASSNDSGAQAFLSAYSLLCGSGAACTAATAAIVADTTCDTDSVDQSVLCTGTCRSLVDNFLNACPANDATVITLRELLNSTCGSANAACANAVNDISGTCFSALNSGNTAACSGTCVTELNAIVSACGADSNLLIVTTFNTLCGEGAACTNARVALSAATTCQSTDSSVLCSGTCRTLTDNFLSACPTDDPNAIAIRTTVNQLCGSGSMLKASGVITLLIVAICALVF